MSANLHICKWGGSLAVRIPKAVAEQCGVSEGSAVAIDVQGGRIVMRKRTYDLADMLTQVTADNAHPEQDIGDAQGNEQW